MVVVDSSVWIDFFSGAQPPGEVRIDRDFDAFVELRGMHAWQH